MYAEISASRRSAGKPISPFVAMIAAMTRSRGAGLATRNVKDFEDCGVELVNPWAAKPQSQALAGPYQLPVEESSIESMVGVTGLEPEAARGARPPIRALRL